MKHLKKNGLLKTIQQLCSLLYPTIQMIRYNKRISDNNKKNLYSFLKPEEQKEVFQKSNFKSLVKTKSVYSDQAYLNVFVNVKKN